MSNIVLSIDTQCINNPELINLSKESLNYEWLKVFTNANKFRNYINATYEKFEIWIVSNDDIDAINLAAAAKKDRPDCVVCLVSCDLTGSLKSRASAAHIDTVLNFESFRERFFANKNNNANNNISVKQNSLKLNNVPNSVSLPKQKKKAFILTILSASGGSGKSCMSAMCGVLCHLIGLKTLVIDADFQFGDLDMLLGQKKSISIDDMINDVSSISQLKPENNGPCLISSSSYPEYSDKIIEQFSNLLENLKPFFDVIIINTSSYWSEQQALLLERDSKSLFLVDQRPSSVRSTKKALTLCNRCGIATGSVLFAVNRCSKHSIFSSVDISCALNGAPVAEIIDGDIDVDEYMSAGEAVELVTSNNPFALSIWKILESILPSSLLTNKNLGLLNVNKKRRFKSQKKNQKNSVTIRTRA